eukprot:m.60173 g.60173  ORF g.60173 m.60173 type:complete len:439 (-) comp13641_c0_seq1:134-1450(-)
MAAEEASSSFYDNTGVSAVFLRIFRAQYNLGELTTQQAFDQVIGPATHADKCAYTQTLKAEGCEFLGPATVKVSHSWRRPLHESIDAMLDYAAKRPDQDVFFWHDLFCRNIHTDLPASEKSSGLRAMGKTAGEVLLVMSPWTDPDALQRGWCVWSVMGAVEDGVPVTMGLPEREAQRMKEAVLADSNTLVNALVTVDADRSVCDDKEAETLLRSKFAEYASGGGLAVLTLEIKARMRTWLLDTVAGFAEVLVASDASGEALKLLRLAAVLRDFADNARAKRFCERALEVLRTSEGEESAVTATAYDQLGLTLHSMGDYAACMEMYEKALKIKKSALGEQHADTAVTLNYMALTHERKGDHAKSLAASKAAVKVQLPILQRLHPSKVAALGDVAVALSRSGQQEEGRQILQACVRALTAVYGSSHPIVKRYDSFLQPQT